MGDSAACTARIIVVFYDSGGSNGGFHARTLPPCFGYSHLARLSRYAHAAWTPWDRARPSIRKEMRTCVAGRYAQTNRRVHQRPPAVLVRRKHEESTYIPTTRWRSSWKAVFLRSQPRFLRCNARLPERYIETENRRRTEARVFKSPILPRWFSNQWFTDSLVAHANFYFL